MQRNEIYDRAHRWIHSGDTGLSSMCIYHVMHGAPSVGHVPHDPADFGRCHRLLRLIPEWRPRLHEVAERHPRWAPLVERWDEMTALYERESPTGKAPELYRLMQRLLWEGMR